MLVNVGDVLAGKYRVDRVLGIGGMGMVVAATHLEIEQRVAIKFMLPDAAQNAAVADRFVREAKAAVKLRSEHVCRVTDYGKLDSGAPYIVMELMEGEDMSALINRRGALPVVEAVDYMLQALEGLADAHSNNIVHRDLKPGNLFCARDTDGSVLVKVLDFGISKLSISGQATKTGEIMGSPAYMAPEQMMSSKNVDARADIFAIGVILYQALTGKLPWEAESLPALCMMVLNEAPISPIAVRADLPPPLADLVLRCLDKVRDNRFANCAELAFAMAPFGGPDAAVAARRVAKVLGKGTAVQAVPEAVGGVERSAPTMADRPRAGAISQPTGPQVLTGKPAGVVSTMTGSAAEISLPPATKRGGGRTAALAGMGLIVVAIAVVVGVAATRGGGDGGNSGSTTAAGGTGGSSAQTAAQPTVAPTPATQAPAPTPAPTPTPPTVAAQPTQPAESMTPVPAPTPTPTPTPTATPTVATPVAHAATPAPHHATPQHAATPNAPGSATPTTSATPNAPAEVTVTQPKPTQPTAPPTQPAGQGSGGNSGVSWTHMTHDKSDKDGH